MLRQYLIQEFERRSRANPKYSMRAFARDLEIHSGSLSNIMNKRRAIGAKTMAHLLARLPISAAEKKKILSAYITPPSSTQELPHQLDEVALNIVKDWEHYAIHSYLQLRRAKHTTEDIANDLNLSKMTVLRAIKNLENAQLLKPEGKRFKVMHKSLKTTTGIPSRALREVHHQYIDKAKKSLDELSVNERDITGTTMIVSSKNIQKAKEIIQQFRLELSELLEQGEADEVYRLNVQLFPLTRATQRKN